MKTIQRIVLSGEITADFSASLHQLDKSGLSTMRLFRGL
jgi:hypothetical protein